MKNPSILFVCTGNICRSPTAHGVFRHVLRERGLESVTTFASAATHAYHIGDSADPRTIAAAARRGFMIDDLRARLFDRADFKKFDLVLAMDRGHERILKSLAPADAMGRIKLFLDYAPQSGLRDMPDPYYGVEADFERVLDLAEAGIAGIMESHEFG